MPESEPFETEHKAERIQPLLTLAEIEIALIAKKNRAKEIKEHALGPDFITEADNTEWRNLVEDIADLEKARTLLTSGK